MMRNNLQDVLSGLIKSGCKTFYIYTHARPDGSIFYVGKGVGDRAKDWWQRGEHHKRVVAKHGRENIVVCAYPVHDERHAYAAEIEMIRRLRLAGISLCNVDDGGGQGSRRTFTEQHKERLRKAGMGHAVSEESRARMRAARLGKSLSEETKKKLSMRDLTVQIEAMRQANLGKKRPESVGAKVSERLKGRKLSPEHCAKIGDSKRGIKHKPESAAKRSVGLKAAWVRRKAKEAEDKHDVR